MLNRALHTPRMAIATETKAFPAYSPTSTPILDGLRPAPHGLGGKLSAGAYFFVSSLLISVLVTLPRLREAATVLASEAASLTMMLVIMPAAALAGAVLIHEIGHLLAGWLAGFRFCRISIGAYPKSQRLHACEMVRVGCLVLELRRTSHLRRRLLVLLLGGAVAGLLFAAGLEFCRDWRQSSILVQLRVHLLAAFSALVGLASLLPDTSGRGNFSDGARLLMVLKNDSRMSRWLAVLEMQLALNDGVHPRDWDASLVVRATAINDDSRDAVTGNWLAYLWASEQQDINSATRYLEDALAAPAACSRSLRDRLFLEAAVFQAWFRDNPGNARAWAALIHESKLTRWERQRLQIALLWAEGKLFDAFEGLPAYFQSLRQLRDTPARDLAEKSAMEWKHQMESRMLTRAWRAMYTLSQQVDLSSLSAVSSASGTQVPSC